MASPALVAHPQTLSLNATDRRSERSSTWSNIALDLDAGYLKMKRIINIRAFHERSVTVSARQHDTGKIRRLDEFRYVES